MNEEQKCAMKALNSSRYRHLCDFNALPEGAFIDENGNLNVPCDEHGNIKPPAASP